MPILPIKRNQFVFYILNKRIEIDYIERFHNVAYSCCKKTNFEMFVGKTLKDFSYYNISKEPMLVHIFLYSYLRSYWEKNSSFIIDDYNFIIEVQNRSIYYDLEEEHIMRPNLSWMNKTVSTDITNIFFENMNLFNDSKIKKLSPYILHYLLSKFGFEETRKILHSKNMGELKKKLGFCEMISLGLHLSF